MRSVHDFVLDVASIVWVLPGIEIGRRRRGPLPMISELRQCARRGPERSPARRAHLRRLISLADRLMPGGANCYRRVLLTIRLDKEAAGQAVHLGLMAHGAPRSGHAWLAGDAEVRMSYDAEIVL